MSKFAEFSLDELHSLQNLIAGSVEDVRSDVVDENGIEIASGMDYEWFEKVHRDTCLLETLLVHIECEIVDRLQKTT